MAKMDAFMPPGVGKVFGQANKFVSKIPGVNSMVNNVPGLNKLMPRNGANPTMPVQNPPQMNNPDIGMAPTNMNNFGIGSGRINGIQNPNVPGMSIGNMQGQSIPQGGTGMEPTEQLKRMMMGMRF